MTTELATTNKPTSMPEVMERVIAMGDLSKLSPQDRISYYAARCEAAGLDPRTQPFQYLSLQGKLTLYATKGATDQLIAIHKLTVEIVERRVDRDMGVFEVHCRVKFPDGHHVEDFAAVSVKGLQGDALCNAYMKGITKSKRRTVLSACGLGMLDETEVETIPGASAVPSAPSGQLQPPQNNSGHGRGQYASEEQTEIYIRNLRTYLGQRNEAWLDRWMEDNGQIPDGVKDLCNEWQADNHLVKWAIQTGRLDPASMPDGESVKNRQIGRYTGIIYHRSKAEQAALARELKRYIDEQEQRQYEMLQEKHPELFADADEAQGMADEDAAIEPEVVAE